MKPTGKMLSLAALLTVVLAASSVRGDGTVDVEKQKDVKQQLEDISRKLDRIINQNQADVRELQDALRRLEERVRSLENLREQLSMSARRNTRFSPSTTT